MDEQKKVKFTVTLVINEMPNLTSSDLEEDLLDILDYYNFEIETIKIDCEEKPKLRNSKRNNNKGAIVTNTNQPTTNKRSK